MLLFQKAHQVWRWEGLRLAWVCQLVSQVWVVELWQLVSPWVQVSHPQADRIAGQPYLLDWLVRSRRPAVAMPPNSREERRRCTRGSAT